jgi:hypothetical protein
MTSTTRSRIVATGLGAVLMLAPAAGARLPRDVQVQAPASTMRDAADNLAPGSSQRTAHQPALPTEAETTRPIVVRTVVDDGLDWGSAALGAGGAALLLLASAAGVATVRRGGPRHGLS